MKVLVLEHCPRIMRALCFSLRHSSERLELIQADNLTTISHENQLQKPKLIILDLDYPDLNFLGFVTELHMDNPLMKFILFSGTSTSSFDKQKILNLDSNLKIYYLEDFSMQNLELILQETQADD